MGFRVVCISHMTAAGGEDVGQMVANQLGFRYVDEEIIRRAAQHAQVDPVLVAKSEHHQPLLQRLLEKIPRSAHAAGMVAAAMGAPTATFVSSPDGPRADAADLRVLIQAAIHEVARAGEAVIVAHAASMALANTEGVLRVLVTASPATRIRQVAELEQLDPVAAERRIATSDRERREYFRRFYKLQEELPTHYDLIVNTDLLTIAQAVRVVLAAAQSPG